MPYLARHNAISRTTFLTHHWLRSAGFYPNRKLRSGRTILEGAKKQHTTATEATGVGDAPFPLGLVYTYRSPSVALRHGGKPYDPRWMLGLLLGANGGVFCAWQWCPPEQDNEVLQRAQNNYHGVLAWQPEQTAPHDAHMDFMYNHFTCSVENLVAGRLHTLVTSGFSHEDFWHLAGNMFALCLFGFRSCAALGPLAFFGLYIAGGFAASSAHVMQSLYHGCTSPRLTSAELRGTLRNALREISAESRNIRPNNKASRRLPFGTSQASSGEVTSRVATKDVTGKESDEDEHGSVFERIGRLMVESGNRLVILSHRNSDSTTRDTSDNVTTAVNGDRNHSQKYSAATSSEDLDRRLAELARETQLLADEAARERQKERETSENQMSKRNNRSWRKKVKEHRRRREQEAMLEAAEKLVFRCYVAPRDMPSLGASGSVMAVANGSVLLFPRDLVVRGGVNLSLPVSAAIYTCSDILGIVDPDPVNLIDHAGHLAGAGMGLLYVWYRWARCSGVRGALPILAYWRSFV